VGTYIIRETAERLGLVKRPFSFWRWFLTNWEGLFMPSQRHDPKHPNHYSKSSKGKNQGKVSGTKRKYSAHPRKKGQ
jgi:hypothetical protein